mgnify:CR=1 FL=1
MIQHNFVQIKQPLIAKPRILCAQRCILIVKQFDVILMRVYQLSHFKMISDNGCFGKSMAFAVTKATVAYRYVRRFCATVRQPHSQWLSATKIILLFQAV